jgi:hypothetical protein
VGGRERLGIVGDHTLGRVATATLTAALLGTLTGPALAAAVSADVVRDDGARSTNATGLTGSVVIDDGAAYMGDPWAWKGSAYEYPSVKLTITVDDPGLDLLPQAWAVSRDGSTWEEHELLSYGTFDHVYELIRTNVDEGVKKVWVRFQDSLGNWSAPVTDTITLRYDYAGHVIVGDGSGFVDSFIVPVRFGIDVEPPEGIASVWLSSNYLGCSPQPYDADCGAKKFTWSAGMTINWDMRTAAYLGSTLQGPRRVIAWVVSTTGRVARLDQDRFIIDREEPVSGPPRPAFDTGTTMSDTTTAANVSTIIKWTTASSGSPIDETRLQQSTNSGTWTSVSLATATATSATRSLSPSATYRFRSKSGDTAGNWSDWTSGATFRVIPIQQHSDSIRYSGTWHTQVRSDASGGSIRYARGVGAKASRTFTGRGVAVVAPRTPTGGEFDVYIDGSRVKSVYLTSEAYQPRRIVYSKSWASSDTHTIMIVKKYENTEFPIFLDAFLVLK